MSSGGMYLGQESWASKGQPRGAKGQQQQKATGPGEVGWLPRLTISGCKHDVVGPIIRGDYSMTTMNHGKPAYRKDAQANGLVVMIYFWDERDGAASSGWWIGPQIGGNMVWGHHPNRTSATPPTSGWQAPHSAPADPTMTVSPASGQSSSSGSSHTAAGKGQSSTVNGHQNAQRPQMVQQRAQWQEQSQDQQWGQKSQHASKLQQWEEQRKKLEEANNKRLEEQQKRIEQQKKQQEELQRKRQEEMKKTQIEQRASATIRKVITKVRSATPETFEQLKEELAQTLAKEFDNCGTQKAKVQEESDKALEQAATRVEQIAEQRKQQELKQKELLQKRKEAEEHAEALLKELAELLEEAEEAAKDFQESAAGFVEESVSRKQDVTAAVKAVEGVSKLAEEKVLRCTEFMKEKGSAMKVVPVGRTMASKTKEGGADEQSTEAKEEEQEEEKLSYQKLAQRMGIVKQSVDKALKDFGVSQEKALRRAGANEMLGQTKAMFAKYDKDKDGMLNKKEIDSFAKGEYQFTMPSEAVELVFTAIVQGMGAGVKLADFQRLKAAVGVARERTRDQERRAAREEKERLLAEQKVQLQASVDAAAERAKAAEEETAQASKQSMGLFAEGKTMQSPAMLRRASELDDLVARAREKLEEAQQVIEGLGDGDATDEALAPWLDGEKRRLSGRVKSLGNSLTKATSTLTRFREEAAKKDTVELKDLSKKAMATLKCYQNEQKVQPRDLFSEVDAEKKGSIVAANFVTFFRKAQAKIAKAENESAEAKEDELSDEDLVRVFASWDDEEEGALTAESFVRLLRVLKKVVKDIVITSGHSIKESKTLRRLEVDEVVEVLEGPRQESESDVQRVLARAMKDGVEGWVTVEGNQGTVFLGEGGGVYKVVKETILTESFEIGAPKEEARKIKETTRKLKVGELVDVREWEKKDEATGLTRMKCKVRQDGLVGYLTTIGNTGIKFVEPV